MAAICKCTENFIATLVDDEVLIVDLDGGELFSLSGTARSVWDAIDGKRDASGIVEAMIDAHQGDPDAIARDVEALLASLEEAALVRPA